jgi:hypothetical protein
MSPNAYAIARIPTCRGAKQSHHRMPAHTAQSLLRHYVPRNDMDVGRVSLHTFASHRNNICVGLGGINFTILLRNSLLTKSYIFRIMGYSAKKSQFAMIDKASKIN